MHSSYTSLGTVNANGYASKYVFDDNNLQKISFYRLKMVKEDNSFEYSNIVTVLKQSKFTVKITPSVTAGFVAVENDFEDYSDATIEIYDQSGKLMIKKAATQSTLVPITILPQGMYFVRVNNGLDFWVMKFVKF